MWERVEEGGEERRRKGNTGGHQEQEKQISKTNGQSKEYFIPKPDFRHMRNSLCFIPVLIRAFCTVLLLLCAFAQQILSNSQLSMHCASNTPRQSQLPFQAVLETWEKEKKRNSVLQGLVVFQVLETEFRLM